MGIKIINSFELNSPLPLDSRAVANNINEMNELITKNFVVAGQMCYNKADNKLYVLKKNSEGALLSWHEVADSVDLDNINKVLPTDIAIKDNKLGLEHDNTWLTNQNAINLGANLEYDATTKTLNAKGGGGSSDTAIITLTAEQVQSISQFNITFTQEQATLLEKATSFKFYYAGNEIAHGQCGKIIQDSKTLYGLSMIIGNNICSGLGSSTNLGPILDYKEKIILAVAFPYGAVSNVRANTRGNVLYIDRYVNNNVFLDSKSTSKTTSIYFDTINGKSIIHEENTINNYTIPTITFED